MNQGQVTIDSLLGEHAALRAHLNIIRGLTREWKQLLSRKSPVWQDSSERQLIIEKHANLSQAMGYLDDGLKQHHSHENLIFPSFLGSLLWEAIILEHSEVLKLLENVNTLVINDDIEKFLKDGLHIMQMIDEVCGLSGSHSSREDGILHFLKKIPVSGRKV